MTKTVILLGTSHRVQVAEKGSCNVGDPDYETLVEQLWQTFSVDFVFEEASGLGPTFAEKFALEEIGPNRYKDIDPSVEQRKKLGKLSRTLKNVRIGGFLTFFGFPKWIPIGAAAGEPSGSRSAALSSLVA